MNRPFSSKITSKSSPATALAPVPSTEKIDHRKKKKEERGNPLQNLNGIITTTGTSSEASSVSIEAPRGCLRFFLSHAASYSSSLKAPDDRRRAHSKNTKSNPKTRPLEPSKSKENNKGLLLENPISRKARLSKNSPSCLYQWQSGKKPSSKTAPKSKNYSVLNLNGNNLESGSEVKSLVRIVGDASVLTELKSCGDDENFSPLNKISTGLHLDCTAEKAVEEKSNKSNSKTPPVQASVSPEIQCGSSVVSTTTPACYGAGHVVSGITDKRKCRPRGFLAVGENDSGFGKGKALGSFDDDDLDDNVKGVVTSADAFMVPLPTEASMHWLLSPCKENEEDHKEDSENGSCRFESLSGSVIPHSLFSPSSGHRFSSDARDSRSITNCDRSTTTLISPSGLPDFQEFLEPVNGSVPVSSFPLSTPGCKDVMLEEGLRYCYDLEDENSPFSMDSLGSGNVVCTPQSDSSTDRHAGLSWLSTEKNKTYQFDSELNSVAEGLHMPSLSHNSHASVKDQIDLSFHFDCLTRSCNSIDLAQFQQVLHDYGSWNSSSTLENESQSQMRISWREGLVSQIYEMDEFDCCRCLSDGEEGTLHTSCQSSNLKDNDQNLTNESWSAIVLNNDVGVYGKGKENFPPGRPQLSNPCAESISTDGGSLLASGDSDWTLCYKNDLFEV